MSEITTPPPVVAADEASRLMHMLELAKWIEQARTMLGLIDFCRKVDSQLDKTLTTFGFSTPDWEQRESDGLLYLMSEVTGALDAVANPKPITREAAHV